MTRYICRLCGDLDITDDLFALADAWLHLASDEHARMVEVASKVEALNLERAL